ncbi:hypothetical protein GCM10027051_30690 [Niabella terrae]
MKGRCYIGWLVVFIWGFSFRAAAQADELAQLALNIEKLSQFRQILSNMKKGYNLLFGGYNTVRNIARGQFRLHQAFLDGLLKVSPTVRKYYRIKDIIQGQIRILSACRAAKSYFESSDAFTVAELIYFSEVYERMLASSVSNLEDLLIIVSAGNLRMSDDERLAAIDHIYNDISEKLRFCEAFTADAMVLAEQRRREAGDGRQLRQEYNR